MKKLLSLFALCLISVAAKAQIPLYETFNSYPLGVNMLNGQTPPGYTNTWNVSAGGANTQIRTNGNNNTTLIPPLRLATSSTNVCYWTSASVRAQLPLPAVTNGPVYFSFIVVMSGWTVGSNTNGDFIAGVGSGALATSTSYYYRLETQLKADGNYVLGLAKLTAPITLDTNEFASGASVFVVGRYNVNAGVSNDTCDLWVNPDPSTFGTNEASVPTPTLSGVGSTSTLNPSPDQINWFYFRGGNLPASHTADELRIGTNWASVTPRQAPLLTGPLPVVNPTFDGILVNDISYQGTNYSAGEFAPDETYTPGGWGANQTLTDSIDGSTIDNGVVNVAGWTGSPQTGILSDASDFLTGQGPTNTAGYILITSDNNERGIFQTLYSNPYEANTRYTLTAQVSYRNGPNSPTSTFPTYVQLVLFGTGADLPGTQTFTPPPAGGTSLATFVYDSGPTPPSNPITIVFRAQGYVAPISEVFFDNVTLTAGPSPASITGIQIVSGNVQVTFTARASESPTSFKLLRSATVNGTYTDSGATISNPSSGVFQAVIPIGGSARFYRIKE